MPAMAVLTDEEIRETLATIRLVPMPESKNKVEQPCARCGHPRSAVVKHLHGGPGETPDRAVPARWCVRCVDESLALRLRRITDARAGAAR